MLTSRAAALLLHALLISTPLQAHAGFTMEEEFAIHPDGTPTYPEKLRDTLRRGEAPPQWKDDRKLYELVHSDDLEAFTDYMQQLNQAEIFAADGSALDIVEWRQAVRDDTHYTNLLKEGFPEVHSLFMSGTDDEVQEFLRAQHAAQAAAASQKSEL